MLKPTLKTDTNQKCITLSDVRLIQRNPKLDIIAINDYMMMYARQ
jgi:hypothetical protein